MKWHHTLIAVLGFVLVFAIAVALQMGQPSGQPDDDAESSSDLTRDRMARSDDPDPREHAMRRPERPIDRSPATPAQRQAAAASITGQLKAFKKDDYSRAMFYQSSALKKNFASPQAFRRVIKNGYPQFANYKAVAFGRADSGYGGQRLEIEVEVTGQDGSRVQAIYRMILEDKIFRVAGVQEVMPHSDAIRRGSDSMYSLLPHPAHALL